MQKGFLILLFSLILFAREIPQDLLQKLHLQGAKIGVVDFFASWCHSCRFEIPRIMDVAHKNKDVKFVGVAIDDNPSDAKRFVNRLGIDMPVVYDKEHTIVSWFNPVGVPALYILKDGKIVGNIIGAHEDIGELLTQKIESLR
ncbi:thioredoxin 1 [Nitratiruptor sp. YY08-26]|uniref:TlpA family protein disulfide reductase n=1 Tax=unclassified Nitratiruptor TaxID=2624044 RepID=UPI001915D71B|nr:MULTISPECIES: TlpA disulfide reductase family protein [unclassified Nitratiruptor]BCD61526.1 thioredoxin 1 [Nitratiruptor sp. YY08-13]BCD65460.1 thioredoxin 1 [Nitratiruptor sp. YY08-26]